MRNIYAFLVAIAFCGVVPFGMAQNTVGVLSFDEFAISSGYNLIFPAPQSNAYLLDNCGRVVNTWTDSTNIRPGNVVHFMADGNLMMCKRDANITGDSIWAGGGGEFIEIRDWDNNLVWSMTVNNDFERFHHDAMPLPNGNILAIVWEKKTEAEAIAAGRNPAFIPQGKVWPDYLLEVTPIGTDSFSIAWEWHAWDHLIQDFDSTKANFGDPSLNPGKINLNNVTAGGKADWLHFNGIDYNETLDQVLISCPEFNEIWIIDHSTTTAQAATSLGGASLRGGDLMFRWGNPMAYGQGDSTDTQLYYQHTPTWIDNNLPSSVQDYNKIMVFNNRIPGGPGGTYSAVYILDPTFDTYDWRYEVQTNGNYEPASPDWTYTTADTASMYSNILSSGQRLPNGNTLVNVGRQGYALEVDATGTVVWEYENPLISSGPSTQGDIPALSSNMMFRMTRYPKDFAAFTGRDMTPGDVLELGSDSTLCQRLDVGTPSPIETVLGVYPNPVANELTIERSTPEVATVEMINLHGQIVRSGVLRGYKDQIEVAGMVPGIYLLRVGQGRAIKVIVTQ